MPCALVVAGLLSVEAGFVVDDDVSLPAGRAAFGADVLACTTEFPFRGGASDWHLQ